MKKKALRRQPEGFSLLDHEGRRVYGAYFGCLALWMITS